MNDRRRNRLVIDKDLLKRLGVENLTWKGTGSNGFECLSEPLFDTDWVESEKTTQLEFFTKLKPHASLSNMDIPGMLPAPVAFMITGIRCFGVTSALQFGAFELQIMSKLYGRWPLWSLALRERNYEFEPILIPSQSNFRARIFWQAAPVLGFDMNGRAKEFDPLQVFLRGYRLRPIQ